MFPFNLKCNSIQEPLGVDTLPPRLSWELDARESKSAQTAYQILVSDSPDAGVPAIWDSGVVESDASIEIPYGGKELASCRQYWWKVRVRDENGRWSGWSGAASFETGLLSEKDWKARWICSPSESADDEPDPAPMFRKSFALRGAVRKARAYLCGLGYFDLSLNGRKVSDELLASPFTRYDETVLYRTYDITGYLSSGENTAGVILGNGWYNCFTSEVWNFRQAPWRNHPMLLLQFLITYEDGSEQFVVSDTSWKVSSGPIVFDGLRNGETYDARLEKAGWDQPGFDDSSWKKARISAAPGGVLRSAQLPPIRLTNTITPVSLKEVRPGVWIYDLGQSFSGWAQIRVTAAAGKEITLRYAEKLAKDGDIDPSNINSFVKSGDFQTDRYITKGEGTEVWEPRFTYHGFRYVQMTGYPGKPELADLRGRVVHTALETRGKFSCSDGLLNAIQKCAGWSTLTNYHGIPTDCPHREKNGWTGDAMLSSEQVLLNYDPISAYTKWMRDFKDAQRPSGQLPGIVPTGGWGYRWGSGPAWDSAVIQIPWNMYVYDGDISILEEMYPYMLRYIDFMTSMSEGFLVDFGLGDWCPPVGGPEGHKCPEAVTSSGYYYADTVIVAKAAGLLGKGEDAALLKALAENIRGAFNEKFVSPDGTVVGNCQTSMACALYQGLVYEQDKPKVFAKLVEQVELHNRHIDCGILGAKYVMHTLSDYGRTDLAYAIAAQTDFPSWGNWIRQGATTLWETWNGDSSLNHHMFSDISAWFYRGLAGLRPDPEKPGFKHTIVKPGVPDGLESAGASHKSPYGTVASGWKKDGNRLIVDVAVPAGCTATATLPAAYSAAAGAENADGESVDVHINAEGCAVAELGSGKYTITGKTK